MNTHVAIILGLWSVAVVGWASPNVKSAGAWLFTVMALIGSIWLA